jgi:hypothetical protein
MKSPRSMHRELSKPALRMSGTASLYAAETAQTFTSSNAFFQTVGRASYTETFEKVPFEKNQNHGDFTQAGIRYHDLAGPMGAWTGEQFNGEWGADPGRTTVLSSNGNESYFISFAQPMLAVGLDVYLNGLGPAVTTFFHGDTVVGSVTSNGPLSESYAGFVAAADALVTSLIFTSTGGSKIDTGIDNLSVVTAH